MLDEPSMDLPNLVVLIMEMIKKISEEGITIFW